MGVYSKWTRRTQANALIICIKSISIKIKMGRLKTALKSIRTLHSDRVKMVIDSGWLSETINCSIIADIGSSNAYTNFEVQSNATNNQLKRSLPNFGESCRLPRSRSVVLTISFFLFRNSFFHYKLYVNLFSRWLVFFFSETPILIHTVDRPITIKHRTAVEQMHGHPMEQRENQHSIQRKGWTLFQFINFQFDN